MQRAFMKDGFLIILTAILVNTGLFAQNINQLDDPGHTVCHAVGNRIAGQLYMPPQIHAQGSPFLNDDWTAGVVILYGRDTARISRMNYNAYLDEMIYFNQALNKYIVIDHQSIQEFILIPGNGKQVLRFSHRSLNDEIRSKYIQVLVEDSVSLYAVRKVELIEDPGYPPSLHPDHYLPINEYYLKKQDSLMVKLKPSNVQLNNIFPDKEKAIKRYVRQHQLKVSNELDLIEVILFINDTDPVMDPFLH
jgi:hypothetical protein